MAKRSYKGIQFANDIKMSFADFKEQYSKIWIFKNMDPKTREKELKIAHKIATDGNVSSGTGNGGKANSKKD